MGAVDSRDLTGVLGHIPTPGAAQAVLSLLAPEESPDEMVITALAGIGSPDAIEPLYRLWQAKRGPLAILEEALLMLCELNGVDKPELAIWRQIAAREHARLSLQPWLKVVSPREDLRAGRPLDVSEFAAHLDQVLIARRRPALSSRRT